MMFGFVEDSDTRYILVAALGCEMTHSSFRAPGMLELNVSSSGL